jgi:hypothetical protein
MVSPRDTDSCHAGDFAARHTFTDYANWISPGYIMVGRYPFLDGSNCKTREQGEARLQQILQAGITTFVSTLGELPKQRDMPIGGVDGFIPYKPTADLIAAGVHKAEMFPQQVVLKKECPDAGRLHRWKIRATKESVINTSYLIEYTVVFPKEGQMRVAREASRSNTFSIFLAADNRNSLFLGLEGTYESSRYALLGLSLGTLRYVGN